MDQQLPWYRYPRLLFHWSICKTTRAYARQARAIQRLVHDDTGALDTMPALAPDHRERLKQKLRQQIEAQKNNET